MTTQAATATPTAPSMPVDPMDAAMAATAPVGDRNYWGEVTTVDVWFCKLVKGQGKIVFDPAVDSIDQRRTAIKIALVPVKGEYTVEQDTIDTDKDWFKHTLPSLRKLGLDLRTLRGRFVQAKRVPTGDTYTNSKGETKDRMALVFVEVYPDREACKAAADAFFAQRGPTSGAEPASAPTTPSGSTDDQERAFAASSLPLLWQASNKSVAAFLGMIASNPLMAKHFNEQSPEVVALTDGLPF